MSVDLHRLAVVLRHANSCPPFDSDGREAFYALKQAILAAYGERDGQDIQHIRKACWNCSEGVYRHYDGELDTCSRCRGTGVYSERWIVLERWKLAGHVFHRPSHTLVGSLTPANIEGRIEHRTSKLAFAAWRVLALLFRPAYYLYLDAFKMSVEQLNRFKAVLAYLLGFSRNKWRVEAVRFAEIQQASFMMKVTDVPMPVPF